MKPGRTVIAIAWDVAPKVYATAVGLVSYVLWECERRTIWRGFKRPID